MHAMQLLKSGQAWSAAVHSLQDVVSLCTVVQSSFCMLKDSSLYGLCMTLAFTMQGSEMTLDFQYAAFLHRLFIFHVIDHLYAPINDTVKQEQKERAHMMWQVGPSLSAP